jgi:hypothetical protein
MVVLSNYELFDCVARLQAYMSLASVHVGGFFRKEALFWQEILPVLYI